MKIPEICLVDYEYAAIEADDAHFDGAEGGYRDDEVDVL